MASNPIVLILGAGPRIGASVADKFASSGYKVAVASRNGSNTKTVKGFLSLKADFTKPDSISALFDIVEAELHAPPNVVIYNAGAFTNPPDKNSVFSIPTENVASDLNVNTITPYVVAQQAVRRWETLPKDIKKTFIFTGNNMNVVVVPMPMMLGGGMGKAATAFWLGVADLTSAAKGYRFFYADERHGDGRSKGAEVSGPAHGEFYAQLANHEKDVPWHATFVKDKGYVQFKS
ncbi:hypothetical protein BJ170DRAFT_600077 [Xylariales sp. AK1849]|nr:hypothetical protein BJ170DRAFT_600077 [Xylariales sp. AK1849]